MATKIQKQNKAYRAEIKKLTAMLNGGKSKDKDLKAEASRLESEVWFKEERELSVVKRDFKVKMDDTTNKAGELKQGKTYEAVEFNNGKIGVYVYGGTRIKFPWTTYKIIK